MKFPAILLLLVLLAPGPAIARDDAVYAGPVVLHKGARFEVCVSSKFAQDNVLAILSFLRVKDGAALVEDFELFPGEGRCGSLSFEQAGSAPVFASVELLAKPQDRDPVISATVINGIFETLRPQALLMDLGLETATTFGPLQIPEGKRMQVCAHNGKSEFETDLSVNFYLLDNSKEPVRSKQVVLEPGSGGCLSLTAKEARGARILADVISRPVEPGFSNPLPLTGAFIVNGLLEEPLPKDFRYLPR